MANLKYKTIIVYDYGFFIPVAERLAKDFGKVLYFCPYQNSLPTYNAQVIGYGIDSIERIDSLWNNLYRADMILFTDIFTGDLQTYLLEQGIPVCGSLMGEELEIFREDAKNILLEQGLSVGKYEVVNGLDALNEMLKKVDDRYIKMNAYLRGHMETWHHETYDLSKPMLDGMAHELGVAKNLDTFNVEEPIEADLELGYDGYCLNGMFPKKSLTGIEIKDEAYIGSFMDYDKLPKPIKETNDGMKEILEKYRYRGPYSTELRLNNEDTKGYLTDFTCRFPEPNTSLAIEAYNNFPDIVWGLAHGKLVEPKPAAKYGVEVIIKSEWALKSPQAIYFPEKVRQWVKIKNHAIIDGTDYYVPQQIPMDGIGAVVYVADTLEKAIDGAKEVAKQVKGYDITIDVGALDRALDKIRKYEKDKKIKILA